MLYPIGRAIVLSFYEWDGLGTGTWAGLDNYRATFSDPRLVGAFGHALVLIIFYAVIPLAIATGVLASLLARSKVRGIGILPDRRVHAAGDCDGGSGDHVAVDRPGRTGC